MKAIILIYSSCSVVFLFNLVLPEGLLSSMIVRFYAKNTSGLANNETPQSHYGCLF